jgi:hypothetical protein
MHIGSQEPQVREAQHGKSRRRRRFTLAGVALAVGALLLAACSSTSTEDVQESESPTQTALELSEAIVSQAGGPTGSLVYGWALQAMGINGQTPTDPAIEAIAADLQKIQSEISALQNEVANLEHEVQTEISKSTYQDRVGLLNTPVSEIQTLGQELCVMATPTANLDQCNPTSSSPGPDATASPAQEAKQIATQVVNQIPEALGTISDSLQGSLAGEDPLVGIWSSVQQLSAPKGTMTDVDIYKNIQTWTNQWVNIQVQGMNLAVEGYHYLGEDNQATDVMDSTWANIRKQYELMGVALASADGVLVDVYHKTVWYDKPLCYTVGSDNDSLQQQNTGIINNNRAPVHVEDGERNCAWAFAQYFDGPAMLADVLTVFGSGAGTWQSPSFQDWTNLYSGNGLDRDGLNGKGFDIPSQATSTGDQEVTNPFMYYSSGCGSEGAENSVQASNGECITEDQSYTWGTNGSMAVAKVCLNGGTSQAMPTPCGTAWTGAFWPANPTGTGTTTTATASPSAVTPPSPSPFPSCNPDLPSCKGTP